MSNPTASSAGDTDLIFVNRVREQVEDMPQFLSETIAANGAQTEYQVSSPPIYDGDTYNPASGSSLFSVTVNGVLQNLVSDPSQLTGANQIAIDFETGYVYWHTSFPPSGTIIFRKRRVRWRNQRILEALYAGVKAMFPVVWQDQNDTSITMQVNQWEYALPAIFADPRVRIISVEIQDIPSTLEQFYPIVYTRPTLTTLRVRESQRWTPGAICRVRYAGPYQSLADLENQVQQLPIWYAKGLLLTNKEAPRARQDTAMVTQQEAANPPGTSQNIGQYFMSLFDKELNRLSAGRVLPVSAPITTYSR